MDPRAVETAAEFWNGQYRILAEFRQVLPLTPGDYLHVGFAYDASQHLRTLITEDPERALDHLGEDLKGYLSRIESVERLYECATMNGNVCMGRDDAQQAARIIHDAARL